MENKSHNKTYSLSFFINTVFTLFKIAFLGMFALGNVKLDIFD